VPETSRLPRAGRVPALCALTAALVVLLALPLYVSAFWLNMGLFAMAAAVGPIMRSEMVEEAPVSHGHDDPHHAHGHGH